MEVQILSAAPGGNLAAPFAAVFLFDGALRSGRLLSIQPQPVASGARTVPESPADPGGHGKPAKQIVFFEPAGLHLAVLQVSASNFVTKDYKNTPLTPRLLKNYD
ncbi:MAG: hypothetical protein AB1330_10730 [Bacillota bacterium]